MVYNAGRITSVVVAGFFIFCVLFSFIRMNIYSFIHLLIRSLDSLTRSFVLFCVPFRKGCADFVLDYTL